MDGYTLIDIINTYSGTTVVSIIETVAAYILTAIAFMILSKRRGMSKSWLAWIPVANLYLIGAVADDIKAQYQIKSNKKMGLLILGAIEFVVKIAFYVLLFQIINALNQISIYQWEQFVEVNLGVLSIMLILLVAFLVLSIIVTVFRIIAYYTIFKEYAPSSAVLFTVLSILFGGVLAPIFVLVISKNVPQFTMLNSRTAYGQNQHTGYQPNQAYQPYQSPQQSSSQPYQSPHQSSSQPYQSPHQSSSQPYQSPRQSSSQPYQSPQQSSQPYQPPKQIPSQPYQSPQQSSAQPYQPPQQPSTQPYQPPQQQQPYQPPTAQQPQQPQQPSDQTSQQADTPYQPYQQSQNDRQYPSDQDYKQDNDNLEN